MANNVDNLSTNTRRSLCMKGDADVWAKTIVFRGISITAAANGSWWERGIHELFYRGGEFCKKILTILRISYLQFRNAWKRESCFVDERISAVSASHRWPWPDRFSNNRVWISNLVWRNSRHAYFDLDSFRRRREEMLKILDFFFPKWRFWKPEWPISSITLNSWKALVKLIGLKTEVGIYCFGMFFSSKSDNNGITIGGGKQFTNSDEVVRIIDDIQIEKSLF